MQGRESGLGFERGASRGLREAEEGTWQPQSSRDLFQAREMAVIPCTLYRDLVKGWEGGNMDVVRSASAFNNRSRDSPVQYNQYTAFEHSDSQNSPLSSQARRHTVLFLVLFPASGCHLRCWG